MAGSAIAFLLLVSTVLGLATVVDAPPLGDRTPMEPATGPSGQGFSSMVYDAESDRVILFSGDTDDPIQDTWAYDLDTNSWTEMNMNPATSPDFFRFSHAMAYDAQSDRAILFGGEYQLGTPLSDTWAYDFNTNTWTDMNPATSPSARLGHRMVYDARADRIILFGGLSSVQPREIYLDDMWAYDFDTNAWTQLSPSTKPRGGGCFAMAYDAESGRVIVFGAEDHTRFYDETWAYDFNTNTWTDMNPAPRPSIQAYQEMAYDAGSDRVILFGGAGGSETWAYDFNGNAWTNMNPVGHPSGRWGHAMAYDEGSDRVVLFGGEGARGPFPSPTNDTWAYDFSTNTWTLMTVDNTPPTTAAARSGTAGRAGWFISTVVVTLSAVDNYGTASTSFRIDGDDLQAYTSPFTVSDGIHTVEYFSTDVAGNEEAMNSFDVKIDTTPPTLSISSPAAGAFLTIDDIEVTWAAAEATSGIDHLEVTLDGGTPVVLPAAATRHTFTGAVDGAHTVAVTAFDVAGNSVVLSVDFTLDTDKAEDTGPFDNSLLIGVSVGIVAAAVAVAALLLWRRRAGGRGNSNGPRI